MKPQVDIGTYEDLSVVGGIPDDIAAAWPALVDCRAEFFNDYDMVYDEESWVNFARTRISDFAVARDRAGQLCCVSYIIPETAYSIVFHAFSFPDYRKPDITMACASMAIRYFFSKYPVHRISTVGRWDNRVARLTAIKLGFTIEGHLREYVPYSGVMQDIYYGSILRREV